MRILIATDSYPPDVSGSSVFTWRLARGLAGRGHDVHVVCASDTGPTREVEQDGACLHRLWSLPLLIHPDVRFTPPPGVPRALRRLVTRLEPEVLHAQDHFTIGRAAIRAARLAGVPVVATNHFMPDNLMPYVPGPARSVLTRAAWRDFKRIYADVDHLTAPTPAAAALLRAQGVSRPAEPVSCGVDVTRFRPRSGSGAALRREFGLPDLPTIGYVGRLDAEKRLDELIRALVEVTRHRPAQLVIAGTGSQRRRLEQLADQVGAADRVHFLGHVPDDRLADVYAMVDVFCMPSVAELQSIATLEAMASGLPVVAADAVALPHLVTPGGNGYLFRPGDVPGLADALETILGSAQRRADMGRASRAMAEEHALERTVARFEEIYAGLTAR
jgi:glycosyltransferase involved in cell wall biosynthesis